MIMANDAAVACERIAILGCGYVGTALAERLVHDGHDVIGTTTRSARREEIHQTGAASRIVRLGDVHALHQTLSDRSVVFLTVAPSGGKDDYTDVYLNGVGHLLTALEGTPVRRVLYTSSTSVYAQEDGAWVNEDSITEPTGRGQILLKTEAELMAGSPEGNVTATVLRLSGIYGPGRDPADWARRYAGLERDDGDAYLNLIHRDDIVEALVALLSVEYFGVLNLNDDRPTPRRELYDRLISDLSLPAIRWQAPPVPKLGRKVSNQRIKHVTGLVLNYPQH